MRFFWVSSKELTLLCLSLAMDWLNRKKGIDPVPKSKACRIFWFSASRGQEFPAFVSPLKPSRANS